MGKGASGIFVESEAVLWLRSRFKHCVLNRRFPGGRNKQKYQHRCQDSCALVPRYVPLRLLHSRWRVHYERGRGGHCVIAPLGAQFVTIVVECTQFISLRRHADWFLLASTHATKPLRRTKSHAELFCYLSRHPLHIINSRLI